MFWERGEDIKGFRSEWAGRRGGTQRWGGLRRGFWLPGFPQEATFQPEDKTRSRRLD